MTKKKKAPKKKRLVDNDPNWMNDLRKKLAEQVKKDEASLPKGR